MSRPKSTRAAQPALPVQRRSRESLERVLAAAESLLAARLFEQVTIADVARRARVAVGSIYLRFPGKDALLPALFQRHNEAVADTVALLVADLRAEPRLRARVERLVAFAVDYHLAHRGLLRALTLYVRTHPDAATAELFAARADQYGAVAAALLGDGREVARGDPRAAVLFGLAVLNSVCREQLLFEDVTPLQRRRARRAEFQRRLADLLFHDLAARGRKPP